LLLKIKTATSQVTLIKHNMDKMTTHKMSFKLTRYWKYL